MCLLHTLLFSNYRYFITLCITFQVCTTSGVCFCNREFTGPSCNTVKIPTTSTTTPSTTTPDENTTEVEEVVLFDVNKEKIEYKIRTTIETPEIIAAPGKGYSKKKKVPGG